MTSNTSAYDGVRLCRRGDVVVVTVNHRLNVFGYCYLAELGGVEPLEAFEVVLLAAGFEVAEAGEFGFGGGDNDLAADLMGDGVLATEFGHEPDSADGEAGFQRSGLVIESAVEDTAVVRALVAAGAILFFKDAY
jgi:para-nitrobenzyl esterase